MKDIVQRLIGALRFPSVEAQERDYLNDATDRVDLERRERQIDRGLFRQPVMPMFRPSMR